MCRGLVSYMYLCVRVLCKILRTDRKMGLRRARASSISPKGPSSKEIWHVRMCGMCSHLPSDLLRVITCVPACVHHAFMCMRCANVWRPKKKHTKNKKSNLFVSISVQMSISFNIRCGLVWLVLFDINIRAYS